MIKSIEPVENKLVVMLTKNFTLHGYKAIRLPKGLFPTSVAAYAYSEGSADKVPYRSTVWYPSGTGEGMLAKVFSTLTPIKQRLFGSRTARRARK